MVLLSGVKVGPTGGLPCGGLVGGRVGLLPAGGQQEISLVVVVVVLGIAVLEVTSQGLTGLRTPTHLR